MLKVTQEVHMLFSTVCIYKSKRGGAVYSILQNLKSLLVLALLPHLTSSKGVYHGNKAPSLVNLCCMVL